jgi:hypothetical protein
LAAERWLMMSITKFGPSESIRWGHNLVIDMNAAPTVD